MAGLGETILTNAVTAEWIPKIIRDMVAVPISKLTLWLGVCLGKNWPPTAEGIETIELGEN